MHIDASAGTSCCITGYAVRCFKLRAVKQHQAMTAHAHSSSPAWLTGCMLLRACGLLECCLQLRVLIAWLLPHQTSIYS